MTRKLRIVADENIPALAELAGDIADIAFLPGRTLKTADLCEADALLVRSVTRVDAGLLQGTPVRFVGTCTIGTDHVDQGFLDDKGIGFASAPGCNAAAVVDYVVAALFAVFPDVARLQSMSVGIVGLGQVGSRLQQRLAGMGITTLACDPFRSQATATLQEILACDIISLHVPYTKSGAHPTHHLLDRQSLGQIRPARLLINTSRGPVVDNTALYEMLQQRRFHTVLDVYEDEPAPDQALLETLDIATAHIAGYSLHGKIRGTVQVVESLLDYFAIGKTLPDLLSPLVKSLRLGAGDDVFSLVRQAYDIKADSQAFIDAMRKLQDQQEKAMAFDQYRKNYPVRHEWSFIEVEGAAKHGWPLSPEKLGFRKK